MVLTEDQSETIAVRAWSGGDREKIMLWGVIHPDNRAEHIRFARAVADELIPEGSVVVDPITLIVLVEEYGDMRSDAMAEWERGSTAQAKKYDEEAAEMRRRIRRMLSLPDPEGQG